MHTPLINDVPQILNLGHAKSAFLQIDTQFALSQGLEDLSDMVYVLFPTLTEDQDVVQVHYHERVGKGPQDIVHQLHEGCGAIRQLKRHDQPFRKALLELEGNLPHIGRFNWYLMITRLQVNLAEIFASLELV